MIHALWLEIRQPTLPPLAIAGTPPQPFTPDEPHGSDGRLQPVTTEPPLIGSVNAETKTPSAVVPVPVEAPASGDAADEEKVKPDSQATQFIRLIGLTSAEFFHTEAGDPYATVPVNGRVVTHVVDPTAPTLLWWASVLA